MPTPKPTNAALPRKRAKSACLFFVHIIAAVIVAVLLA
jgi:hypothetical protein